MIEPIGRQQLWARLLGPLTVYEYRSSDTPPVVLDGVLEQRQKTGLAAVGQKRGKSSQIGGAHNAGRDVW